MKEVSREGSRHFDIVDRLFADQRHGFVWESSSGAITVRQLRQGVEPNVQ
jgi:hypothetical protein